MVAKGACEGLLRVVRLHLPENLALVTWAMNIMSVGKNMVFKAKGISRKVGEQVAMGRKALK